MKRTYLLLKDLRSGNACHTGFLAVYETAEETLRQFETLRALRREGGGFRLELYVEGVLTDALPLDSAGVYEATGFIPASPEFYVEYERELQEKTRFWKGRVN